MWIPGTASRRRTDSVSSANSIVLMEVDQDGREESECEEICPVREVEISTDSKTVAEAAPEMIELEDSDDEEEIISLGPSTSQVEHIPVENQVVTQREPSPPESPPAADAVPVREAVMPSLETYSDNLLVLPGQAAAVVRAGGLQCGGQRLQEELHQEILQLAEAGLEEGSGTEPAATPVTASSNQVTPSPTPTIKPSSPTPIIKPSSPTLTIKPSSPTPVTKSSSPTSAAQLSISTPASPPEQADQVEDIFDQMDQSFSGSLLERLGKSATEAKVSNTDQDACRKKSIEYETASITPIETVEYTIVNRVKDDVLQPESVVTRNIIEEETQPQLVQQENTDESNMDVEVPVVVEEPQPPAPAEAPAEAVSQDVGRSSTDLLHRILASLLQRMKKTDEGILMGLVSCRTVRSV